MVYVAMSLVTVSSLDQETWLVAVLFNWVLAFVVVSVFLVGCIILFTSSRGRFRVDPTIFQISLAHGSTVLTL